MEEYMIEEIPKEFRDKCIALGIPDRYRYMDQELQALIKERYLERTAG